MSEYSKLPTNVRVALSNLLEEYLAHKLLARDMLAAAFELGCKAHAPKVAPQWAPEQMEKWAVDFAADLQLNPMFQKGRQQGMSNAVCDQIMHTISVDIAKPGSDMTGVSIARYAPMTQKMSIEQIKDFWRITGTIPTVFEDEEHVGGPYSKLPEADPQPVRINPAHDKRLDEMNEDEKKVARARIAAAMGWKD